VLVVSEICAKEHRISATQAAGTRGKAGVVGESSSCAAVGVAEEGPVWNGLYLDTRRMLYYEYNSVVPTVQQEVRYE
jgi:hypothetical protein